MEERKKSIVLIEDPLSTKSKSFLEEILTAAEGYKFVNAVQHGSPPVNFAIPSNSDKDPLNKYLPGGIIIRARYITEDIRARYNKL